MAAVTTPGFRVHEISRSTARLAAGNRRHYITPDAGHALEILGHAIEYLADEFAHDGKAVDARDPQVEAIQLLMKLNRQIYYECPVMRTFPERVRAFFHVTSPAG
jgi:hypothetical protein